jgi:hypothetical protein
MGSEIKRLFKQNNLEIRALFQLKYEFQRRDVYAFSFESH